MSQACYEDVTRKLLSWNLALSQRCAAIKTPTEYCEYISDPKDTGGRRSNDRLANEPELHAARRTPNLESDRKSRDAAVEAPPGDEAVGWQRGADVEPRGRLPHSSTGVDRRPGGVANRQQLCYIEHRHVNKQSNRRWQTSPRPVRKP